MSGCYEDDIALLADDIRRYCNNDGRIDEALTKLLRLHQSQVDALVFEARELDSLAHPEFDETDDIIDVARERIRNEREALAEFARPEFDGPPHNFCEICLQPAADGGICPRCDLWDVGFFEENKWRYSE